MANVFTNDQSQSEIDAANLKTEIAKLHQAEAEARKATAVAEADAANAAATARNTLAKAQADTEKAQVEAANAAATAKNALAKAQADTEKARVEAASASATSKNALTKAQAEAEKAQAEATKANLPTVPDAKKYAVQTPTAPVLNATVTRLTFEQAEKLANKLLPRIKEAIGDSATSANTVLLSDDIKVRTLLALQRSTTEALMHAKERLASATNDLEGKMPVARVKQAFAESLMANPLPLISTLAETVLSFASILRTQYGFATASTTSNADAMLLGLVHSGLLASGKVDIVDVEAVLPPPTDGLKVANMLEELSKTIATARNTVSKSGNWSKSTRDSASARIEDNDESTKKARMEALRSADEVDRLAGRVGATADEADKLLSALFVVDAQGNTPYDAALRGEVIRTTLSCKTVLTLVLKVIAAEADTVATDRLFWGLKIHVGNATVARWKLIKSDGSVKGVGVDIEKNAPALVELFD